MSGHSTRHTHILDEGLLLCSSMSSSVFHPSLISLSSSLKYKCLIDCNANNNGPKDLVQQTFSGKLQHVVQPDLPRSLKIYLPKDKTILLAYVKTCDTTENEDGFWEYTTMKPSPHFMDLKTIICIIGRVFDWGCWTFINRSGPTAHIKMATPSSSSQSSDVTNFLTTDESDSELASSSANGSPMDLDISSTGSSG